jgi:hypothetical protein
LRKQAVATIVCECLDKLSATAFLRNQAKESVPLADQLKFIEVVETELMNLHEGNISRYGLRLADYEKWHRIWK